MENQPPQQFFTIGLTRDEILLILDALALVKSCALVSSYHASVATEISDRLRWLEKALPSREAQ